jgi:hypothetical protein
MTLNLEQLNTIRVALNEWGDANCHRDYRECGDGFCRSFSEAAAAVENEMERQMQDDSIETPDYLVDLFEDVGVGAGSTGDHIYVPASIDPDSLDSGAERSEGRDEI